MDLEIMTATAFIRQAALRTGTVPVAMGKVVQYQDVLMVDVKDARCWLCGGPTGGKGQPIKKAIKPTFTNVDMARAHSSKSLCPGCVFCLSFRELRNYSILASADGLRHPTRAEIRDILLEPPEPPFVLCIAESGQKHLTFRVQVAYSRDGYPVQVEETRVCVERPVLAEWLNAVETLYTVFSKEEIKTGRYGQNRIKQFGMAKFQEVEARVAGHRGTRLFDLAVFVAQKREIEVPAPEPEKKEEICTTTSTQMIPLGQLALF